MLWIGKDGVVLNDDAEEVGKIISVESNHETHFAQITLSFAGPSKDMYELWRELQEAVRGYAN